MAWVASQFDPSLRSDKLSWSHHVLLAPLEPDDQQHWLERAQKERLSVADLRLELRRSHGDGGKLEAPSSADPKRGTDVCPHCGHKLDSATE
jgi:predicted metalloenzyme YecM